MEQWMRIINVKAGGKEFKGDELTIEFDVPFNSEVEEVDISTITIFNLTDSTINQIKKEASVILNAGYQTDYGHILSGKIDKVNTEWQGNDKKTIITVADGKVEMKKTPIEKTYAAGTTAKNIMQDIAGYTGLEIGEINPAKDITYQLGKTIKGTAENALKQLVKDTKSKMFISKQKLYIRAKEDGTPSSFRLSSDTGLISTPTKNEEEDEKGNVKISYEVKCLLNYQIGPDAIIQIKSRAINGSFRVTKGKHNGGSFHTEITVVPA